VHVDPDVPEAVQVSATFLWEYYTSQYTVTLTGILTIGTFHYEVEGANG